MTVNDRIKIVRKRLDLTQQEFADRLGLKRNSVSLIESGRNTSEQTIIAICREFGVRREWLETGEGEMEAASPTEELDALAKKYRLRHKDYVLVEKFVALSSEERDSVFRFMQDVISGANDCGADPDAFVFPDESQKAKTRNAEALYERSLGFVPNEGSSASSTTEDTASSAAANE